ncbi:MAG: hypothetical protein JST75_19455 [Bacteroidetes bacterium]|nr:hypothetical protein [Bacteroidota bacterium]
MKITYVALSLILILVIIFSCQHQVQFPTGSIGNPDTTTHIPTTNPPPNPPPPITGSSCSPDTVYFTNTILPMMNSNCAMSGCHDGLSRGDAGQYTLNTYSGIMAIVRAGNANSSKLVSVIANGTMPPRGHTAISAAQLDLIKTWINQGALNNTCTETTCDTTNVTYSASIVPILQSYCTGCHGGSGASAGVDLSVYSGVLAQVQNGKLWGDVSHSTGYNAMPVGGAMLSSCDLNKISIWIKNGAPNN